MPPSPRVLIVEDEEKLRSHLRETIQEKGFSTFTCETFKELETILDLPDKRFDIVILDRLLHGKDSASLIGKIKRTIPDIKIIVLSAINTGAEKALLLSSGADDYMAKPFDSSELLARIQVQLRNTRIDLVLGNMVLNLKDRTVKIDENDVDLTNREFILLKALSETPGRIFSKSVLYEQVWEVNKDIDSNVVETTINKIRRRLEEAGANVQIKNARNLGYWIEE